MEGQRGRIDATDQIKQLLRLPPEGAGAGAAPKPAPSENKSCIPPQLIPHHKQVGSTSFTSSRPFMTYHLLQFF